MGLEIKFSWSSLPRPILSLFGDIFPLPQDAGICHLNDVVFWRCPWSVHHVATSLEPPLFDLSACTTPCTRIGCLVLRLPFGCFSCVKHIERIRAYRHLGFCSILIGPRLFILSVSCFQLKVLSVHCCLGSCPMARGATVKQADLTVGDGLDKLKRRGPFFLVTRILSLYSSVL